MIKEGIFYFDEREIHTGLWESVQERRTARIKAFDMGAGGKGEVANTEDTSDVRWSSDVVWLYAVHSGAMLKTGWGWGVQ